MEMNLIESFMAAVIGLLAWIGFELHSVKKKIGVEASGREGAKSKPQNDLEEGLYESQPIGKPRT